MNADQGDERRSEGTAEKLRASDDEVIHKELTGEIIAAFYHVYNTLGYGFLERVYRNALASAESLCPAHEAQLLNYLRATDIEVGLLLNFGPKPQVKRKVFPNARKRDLSDRPPTASLDLRSSI
jgi:hypothetical protein